MTDYKSRPLHNADQKPSRQVLAKSSVSFLALSLLASVFNVADARADEECGPVSPDQPRATCRDAFYPGITYGDGGTIFLENTSMHVEGDITVGGSRATLPAQLNAQSFSTIQGNIKATAHSGHSDVLLYSGKVEGSVSASSEGPFSLGEKAPLSQLSAHRLTLVIAARRQSLYLQTTSHSM
nr:hypothetical protein [Marinicella sp. W31]MDC2877323.1 hypothetical protein [Marinicella sp. W31]